MVYNISLKPLFKMPLLLVLCFIPGVAFSLDDKSAQDSKISQPSVTHGIFEESKKNNHWKSACCR